MKKWCLFQLLTITVIAGLLLSVWGGFYLEFIIFFIIFTYLSLGIFEIRMSVYLRNVNKIDTQQKIVALTFDDGPIEKTNHILDILKNKNIKATFFCIGENAEKHPEIIKRILSEGHSIGSHTQHHGWKYTFQSRKKIESTIDSGAKSIQKITGIYPVLFRPPFGITNPSIAYASERLGLQSIGWTIRSLDTQSSDSEQLKNKIIRKIKPGSIILLHDYVDATAQMLPQLIDEIKELGYDFACINTK